MGVGPTKSGSFRQASRLRIAIRGAVQGVGFRPFVFRLASELGLAGWVKNSNQGVLLEAEGPRAQLETFLQRLQPEKPPRSFIQSLEASWLDAVGYGDFVIHQSDVEGNRTALVLPDIAVCDDCVREMFDSDNRRFFYPFINCSNCGPRFSLIESLPYDRAHTSMKSFRMCAQCQSEYDNPVDRRFHAQPNACPLCGPHLELWQREGPVPEAPDSNLLLGRGGIEAPHALGHCSNAGNRHALIRAAETLRAGKIVAVKGLGGFHLMVAAADDAAVSRLRQLKHREEKPFALMFPSLATVKKACQVSAAEERLLCSPEAPIVLLQAAGASFPIAPSVSPNNPFFGVLLPYTPLHHLLLSLVQCPIVATSGNLSDEPICIDEHEALQRLGGIADLFLVHNRPIVRHVDDSIARVVAGREQILRRARGYAPLPIQLPPSNSETENVLAVGAHLKNAIALSVGPQVFVSQHIGDLETEQAYGAFQKVIRDFESLYQCTPGIVAADLHPDYLSTKFARTLCEKDAPASSFGSESQLIRYVSVQHHLAHILSCMAENQVKPPVLGVAFDGTGYGTDGTIWGGEFLFVGESSCTRLAYFRPFRLPGGELAIKEPRRTALGLLYELFGDRAFENKSLAPVASFSNSDLATLKTMLERGLNAPLTTSAGRLFDAVASLTGVRQKMRFEGQAAMELEFAIGGLRTEESYPLELVSPAVSAAQKSADPNPRPQPPSRSSESEFQLDWSALIRLLLADVANHIPVGLISARFHNALIQGMVRVARSSCTERVILSGGCFQNQYLLAHAFEALAAEGFRPYWPQRIPPNDGGIALGQVVAALREITAVQ